MSALSVLLVDDYADGADTLAELLRLHGHCVRVAYSPEAALDALPADVVILELKLHGTDGWSLVRQMQHRAVEKLPLFVAVTTCGSPKDRQRSEEAGIDLHLIKPVEPAILVGLLRRFSDVLISFA
ncbi:MAG: response regulator [Planctomycetes bacterium]|nr:response regulator [Planctomycetota bacterium]